MGTGVDRFVDATTETEVELRLPLGAGMEPDQIPKDIPMPLGAVSLDVVIPNLEEHADSNPRTGSNRIDGHHGAPPTGGRGAEVWTVMTVDIG